MSDPLGGDVAAAREILADRAAGWTVARAEVHALLAIEARLGEFAAAAGQIAALLAFGTETAGHPPVPEQAVTPAQAWLISENADLWAGWAPGWWPVHDGLDPRGFRWADPLGGP